MSCTLSSPIIHKGAQLLVDLDMRLFTSWPTDAKHAAKPVVKATIYYHSPDRAGATPARESPRESFIYTLKKVLDTSQKGGRKLTEE